MALVASLPIRTKVFFNCAPIRETTSFEDELNEALRGTDKVASKSLVSDMPRREALRPPATFRGKPKRG